MKDYEWRNELRYVRIHFDTLTFDRITKDQAAKFVDMLSAIGGTMGLLTGFSIISAVEIGYFVIKIILQSIRNQGLCRLGLEFFSNGPENIYLHQTK